MYERLELFIETLTGSLFQLFVSQYETVQDVKARLQKREGIPISQQHLIWQTVELEDDYCLLDYNIPDKATLKLVLNMRGGPINTRRVPMEDPAIREMAEFLSETSADELMDKTTNRPVTVIVCTNGDQVNFFRLVDRDSTSPLSESLCQDFEEEEEDEDSGPSAEKYEENDKTREKMKLLKSKMENLTLSKKPKAPFVPRPPSGARPGSKTRLRRLTVGSNHTVTSLNPKLCLPPVRATILSEGVDCLEQALPVGLDPATIEAAKERFESAAAASIENFRLSGISRLESIERRSNLTSVIEDVGSPGGIDGVEASADDQTPNCDNIPKTDSNIEPTILNSVRVPRKWEFSKELLMKQEPKPPTIPRQKETKDSGFRPSTSSTRGLEALLEKVDIDGTGPGRPGLPSHDVAASSTKDHVPLSSKFVSDRSGRRSQGGVVLESLHPSEVRAMSGMLSSLVRSSASKSRLSCLASAYKDGRVTTPEARKMSSRLHRYASSKEQCISPTYRLPPVKQKKKSKRCSVCGRKTTLTNTYSCRCSNDFCATHRYAEAHNCSYDYKSEGRKLLEQSNPVVTAPKLPKI